MKRSVLIAALSALMLALFATAPGASPATGGDTASGTRQAPAEQLTSPMTSYEACLARTSSPEGCQGLSGAPPRDCSVDGRSPELCEGGATGDLQTINQAAQEAATSAVDEARSTEGVLDLAAAYLAALDAAREAGADEETASVVADDAARGAVAEEAAGDAAAEDGSGAVDGTAAYLAALGGTGEADEEVATIPTIPSDEAGTPEEAPGVSEDRAFAAANERPAAKSSASVQGDKASPSSSEDEGPAEAAGNILPAAEGSPPLTLLGAGAVLVAVGVVGFLIRRRLAL